jgi:hypothetical protein
LEEVEVGELPGQGHNRRAEAAASWGDVDKTEYGDGVHWQVPVFGKVNPGEMNVMDGGTLNRATDGSPVISGVDSSRWDIEWYRGMKEARR